MNCRALEREALRGRTAPYLSDKISIEWCLGQVVLAICNLAETVDARGAGILDRLPDREGDR
jgi:hypothetical protein